MTPHRPSELDLLVPDYVSGRLDNIARLRVAAYVEEAEAGQDLAFCRLLRKETRISETQRPSEAEWRTAWEQISRQISPIRHITSVGRADQSTPSASRRSEPSWRFRSMASWSSAAALFGAVLGAAVVLHPGALSLNGEGATPGENAYHLAGEPRPGEITVQFSTDATAQQIHDLLVGLELTVVDGPNALGAYQLRLADRDAGPAGIDRAVEALRTHEIVSDARAL